MSTIIMGQCWPIQLPPTAKAVLISLADQANDEGYCWPSISTIAKRTCYRESACRKATAKLEQLGYLVKEQRHGTSTMYRVVPSQGGLYHVQGGVSVVQGGAARGTGPLTRTIIEPSLNLLLAPSAKTPALGAAGNPKVYIPVNDGSEYGVTDLQIEEFGRLYPAVDVPQTLNEIRGWNLTHPQRRKTRRGILSHINGWLAKEQNRGPQAG